MRLRGGPLRGGTLRDRTCGSVTAWRHGYPINGENWRRRPKGRYIAVTVVCVRSVSRYRGSPGSCRSVLVGLRPCVGICRRRIVVPVVRIRIATRIVPGTALGEKIIKGRAE